MLLRRPRAQERPLQVRVDDRVPVIVGHLVQQVVADDPRARHQHVDAAEFLDRAVDHRLHRLALGDVACDRQALDRVRNLARRRLVHVRDHELRSLAGEQLGGGGADSAAASGDQRDAVLEPHRVAESSAVPPSLRGSDAPSSRPSTETITCGREKYES